MRPRPSTSIDANSGGAIFWPVIAILRAPKNRPTFQLFFAATPRNRASICSAAISVAASISSRAIAKAVLVVIASHPFGTRRAGS